MSRREVSKSDETRSRILTSALELFRDKGFHQTTMRDIANRSGLAVGAAYYYFRTKDELVLAFYDSARRDLAERIDAALRSGRSLETRLRAILQLKFDYFAPNRSLLAALAGHVDPASPLSPFSDETSEIRDQDVGFFARSLDGLKVPADLAPHLPRLLWMFQMGLILFWIHDRSDGQQRTAALTDKSVKIVAALIRLSTVPLMRPVRRSVVDLLETIYDKPAQPPSAAVL